MARTAPAPNIPAIPGMNPGIFVMGGGGDGGGGGGADGGARGGSDGAGGGGDGKDAAGGGKGAPDANKYPDCGTVSHPVDVVTGRAFTHPITILDLSGPLPLRWTRSYSSAMAERDTGLGFGWGHTLGWEIEIARSRITVWTDLGTAVDFPIITVGEERIGRWGWLIRREMWGFIVDAGDHVRRLFSYVMAGGKRARLTAVEDRNGNRISLTYDDTDGRLVEVTDSAGRTVRVVASKNGRISTIEVRNAASQGRWVAVETYTHDSAGDLISVVDADGFSASYAYDEDHLLTRDTDRTGLTFHFVYDHERRCVESWGDYPGRKDPSLIAELPIHLHGRETRCKGIHHCKIDYHRDGFTEVFDSTQSRQFFGNSHGTLDKSVIGGGVTTAVYRADGHLLARTNPMLATERFERNARGSLIGYTDAIGRITTVIRDANDLPVEVVDPKGGVHRMDRDPRGNPTLHADPTGAVTSFRHDARGLLTERVSPTGERTTYEYDAHGNLGTLTLPGGGVWRFTYDFLGRRRGAIDPVGAETRYVWSARGDLLAVQDAAGGVTQYAYDGEHHLTQITDPKGGVTTLTWGGYHKLCARRDANGHEVRLGYNVEGELVLVRNENGEKHTLTYDPSGKLIEEVTFDRRTLRYRRDWAGQLIKSQNGEGHATVFTYDLAGQLVKRELWDATIESFTYDELGDLIGAEWPKGEIRFHRDALGRIVREAQTVNGKTMVVDVKHNAEGERIERTTSLRHRETIERGPLGARRKTVLDGEHVVEHEADVLGRERARTLPGGGRIESAFDSMGRLERRRVLAPVRARGGEAGEPAWVGPRDEHVTVETAYRYDPAGELVASVDKARGQTTYHYDPVGQLLARVPEKARAEVFRYDPAGNLHEAGEGAEERAYGHGNRLIRKGNTEYSWDLDGRLAQKRVKDAASGREEVWAYAWDEAGLLQAVTTPGGERIEFAYDPFGRRVEKWVGMASAAGRRLNERAVTRFVWDGDVLVHEITRRAQAAGDPVVEVKTYCFEDDGFVPVAHRDAGGWFHYVNDPIGTPERLVDAYGEVACDLRRDAWGRTEIAPGGKTTTAIRFQGQYEDDETGHCYNRLRYYDPSARRFISPDPVGLSGGVNSLAYGINPVGWVDPWGLATHDDIAHGGWFARKDFRRKVYSAKPADYDKHNKARTCEQAQSMSSGKGAPAQYLPGVNNRALEREALLRGALSRGAENEANFHKLYKADTVVGYSEGKPTRWIRAEFSGGEFHGHPRSLSQVREYIPDATE